jgi:hypothetical protein
VVGTRFQRSHERLPGVLFAIIAFTVLFIKTVIIVMGLCGQSRPGSDRRRREEISLIFTVRNTI